MKINITSFFLLVSFVSCDQNLHANNNNDVYCKPVIGVDLHGVFFKEVGPRTFIPDPEVVKVLREVKARGYSIYLISNTKIDKLSTVKAKYAPEFSVFDGFYFFSESGGIRKTDVNFFMNIREWLGKRDCATSKIIYFDDQQPYIDNAKIANQKTVTIKNKQIPVNIEGYLFTSAENMRSVLQKQGIL